MKLLTLYVDFMEDILKECNLSTMLANAFLSYEDPIYGKLDDEFTTFLGLGAMQM